MVINVNERNKTTGQTSKPDVHMDVDVHVYVCACVCMCVDNCRPLAPLSLVIIANIVCLRLCEQLWLN